MKNVKRNLKEGERAEVPLSVLLQTSDMGNTYFIILFFLFFFFLFLSPMYDSFESISSRRKDYWQRFVDDLCFDGECDDE